LGLQLGEAGEGQTSVSWTYEVDPVISETRESVTKFMIDFYTANLKYLEVGANKLVATNSEAAAAGSPKPLATGRSIPQDVLPAQAAPVQAA